MCVEHWPTLFEMRGPVATHKEPELSNKLPFAGGEGKQLAKKIWRSPQGSDFHECFGYEPAATPETKFVSILMNVPLNVLG